MLRIYLDDDVYIYIYVIAIDGIRKITLNLDYIAI